MDTIFHEKQEASLCAQHCLNALLQGEYFTAVDLATIAHQIDEQEREKMAEGGVNSADYRQFLQQPSGNLDDSGYFSVQVIASALKVWGLELVPYSSSDAIARTAQKEPTKQKAYICNYKEHWFTVRKLGKQWFNLNSLLTGPELISDTYLSMFLAQLQQEGYSIFIVIGILPECSADHVLELAPVVQHEKPKLLSEVRKMASKNSVEISDDERQLQEALQQSLESTKRSEDALLQAALSMSLKGMEEDTKPSVSSQRDPQMTSNSNTENQDSMSEEEMLKVALKMSMET